MYVVLAVAIILYLIGKLTCAQCYCMTCLKGKTALITGGNSGIGFQVALKLASRGCRVIIAARTNLELKRSEIIRQTNNRNIIVKYLDLKSNDSIRRFAKEMCETEKKLDILINNSGIANTEKIVENGVNTVMQVNFFGPFLLTHLLMNLLKKSGKSRIIFTSSTLSFFNNLSMDNFNFTLMDNANLLNILLNYSNSKLCVIIASKLFAEKLKNTGITSNCLHPGIVATDIFSKSMLGKKYTIFNVILVIYVWIYSKNQRDGAQTTVHLALNDNLGDVSGKFFLDCHPFPVPSLKSFNTKFCEDLWRETEKIVGLLHHEKL